MQGKVVVITGPTASGKTRLGVELARRIGGEVVGADAMQVYRDMDIGTAKPTAEEMGGVPHHLIGYVSPAEDYSVSRYVEDAARCIAEMQQRGKLPVLVGGTGLYIDSLLSGRSFAENGAGAGLREELSREYDEKGGTEMLRQLAAFDPASAARLHSNDKKRIVRAFEVYRLTGRTISQYNSESRSVPPRYQAGKIVLSFADRADLYSRIDRRVDRMMADGLAEEVRSLLEQGLRPECTAFQAIGYKEVAGALRSGGSLQEAAELVKLRSRQYAKRQLSWLRRDESAYWIFWKKEPDFQEGLQNSTMFLKKTGII